MDRLAVLERDDGAVRSLRHCTDRGGEANRDRRISEFLADELPQLDGVEHRLAGHPGRLDDSRVEQGPDTGGGVHQRGADVLADPAELAGVGQGAPGDGVDVEEVVDHTGRVARHEVGVVRLAAAGGAQRPGVVVAPVHPGLI